MRTRTRGGPTSKDVPLRDTITSPSIPSSLSNTWPVLLVCVEKLANLFRVLVLCHDYPGALSNLVLVTHPSLLSRFQKESNKTVTKLTLTDGPSCKRGNDDSIACPRVLSIADATALVIPHKSQTTPNENN